MIEAGRYKAKAIEWKLGVTGGGNEQIGVLFQLENGETITWYGYFSEKTADGTLDALERMGWDGVDITNPIGLDANEVQLVIEDETNDEGKVYPRVRWVNKIGGIAMKEELTGGALQSFKQRMNGAVMARRQKGGKPAARPQQRRQERPMRQPGDDSYPDHDYGSLEDGFDDIPI